MKNSQPVMQCNARQTAALLIPQGFTLKLLPSTLSSPLQESVSHILNKFSATIPPCYRQRLRDNWGIVDVDDCANAAQYLAKQGKVDGERLTIDGGSAGGQQLKALCTLIEHMSSAISIPRHLRRLLHVVEYSIELAEFDLNCFKCDIQKLSNAVACKVLLFSYEKLLFQPTKHN